MKLSKRPTIKIKVLNWLGDFEEKAFEILKKEEFAIFNKRFIFSQRPFGISGMKDSDYIRVSTPNSVPKNCGFTVGVYAIKVKDFREILNSLPHFESKEERKKAKHDSKNKSKKR